jgi:hypothetical protein
VDSWLTSLGLEKYVPTFEKEGIDDFLGLPFLRVSCLDDLKVHSPDDRRTLTQAISALQEVSPPECTLSLSLVLCVCGCDLQRFG